MKKSLVALAALAVVGAASAQSSVTLFGVVDATFQQVKGDNNGKVTRLTNSGLNSSRLGFRGTEDLGGGMSASFWLEAGLTNDDGTMAASNVNNQLVGAFAPATGANAPVRAGTQGLTFNRRSTVSLAGGFGELRLGRDYVPAFWNHTVFDPFGTNGVGAVSNVSLAVAGGAAATGVRASNSIGYFLPGNIGGIYGQAMYALGENAQTTPAAANEDDGKHIGLRLGYANGPINVAVGYGKTDYIAVGDYKNANLGASYKFGAFSLMGQLNQEKLGAAGANLKHNTYMLGGLFDIGAGQIRASFTKGKAKSGGTTVQDGDQIAIGYVHNLSKRTAVYTTYARASNDTSANLYSVGRASTTVGGGKSTGFDLGVRHSF
jgi:predicted porin